MDSKTFMGGSSGGGGGGGGGGGAAPPGLAQIKQIQTANICLNVERIVFCGQKLDPLGEKSWNQPGRLHWYHLKTIFITFKFTDQLT